jgi:nucleoside-diphosphate-sugar epimerase
VNVGSGGESTLLDLVAGIEAAAGAGLAIEYGSAREGDIRRSCASISLGRSLLGYEPRTALREGLAQTLAWYRDSVGAVRG